MHARRRKACGGAVIPTTPPLQPPGLPALLAARCRCGLGLPCRRGGNDARVVAHRRRERVDGFAHGIEQRNAHRGAHLVLDLDRQRRVLAQELARVVLALPIFSPL